MKYNQALDALLLAGSGVVTPALQADDGLAALTDADDAVLKWRFDQLRH